MEAWGPYDKARIADFYNRLVREAAVEDSWPPAAMLWAIRVRALVEKYLDRIKDE